MLTAKLILERFDKNHRLLERREQPSRSFLKNFISLLYIASAQLAAGAGFVMTDIAGVARTIDGASGGPLRMCKGSLMIGAPPGNSQCIVFGGFAISSGATTLASLLEGQKVGIQVGTGVTAVAPTNTALATRIVHGSSAGQLEYGGCELLSIAFADPNGQFTIRRYFTNNSGGSITVQEVGIHSPGGETVGGSEGVWAFLIARDLTGGLAVANTQLLRVTYVVQITV